MTPGRLEQMRRSTVAGPLPVPQTLALIDALLEAEADREKLRAELAALRPVVAELRQRLGAIAKLTD